ncbi:MAG: LysE family translocator [Bosea sp. (in: a-proteobacteria)]
MSAYLPDASVMLAYTLASIILFITPGPDMSLFLARTLAGGRKAGVASLLGASAGCVVHSVLVAVGVSALLAASQTAFLILKVVGAGYLLWLAVDAIRNGSALSIQSVDRQDVPFWRTFMIGLGINLTNPKVVLFFVTFLPQFISASDPNAAGKLLFLGIYYMVITLPLAILMIFGAERLIGWLRTRPGILRGIDWSFAGIFSYFALKIALTEGR